MRGTRASMGLLTAAIVTSLTIGCVGLPADADAQPHWRKRLATHPGPPPALGTTQRLSHARPGTEEGVGDEVSSDGASISADGRYVAFGSGSANIVAGDTNGKGDVFVTDTTTRTTTRVSLGPGGRQDVNGAGAPSISANGRFVAFGARASLATGRPDDYTGQIFVRDRVAGTTTLITKAVDGRPSEESSQSPSISADGRYVAYTSSAEDLGPADHNDAPDVYVTDRVTGASSRVTVAADGGETRGGAFNPVVSGDGRFVAYDSASGNLVSGGEDVRNDNVYRTDRLTGRTACLTCATESTYGHPSISTDGRLVSFVSHARDVVPGHTYEDLGVYVADAAAGRVRRLATTTSDPYTERSASLSPDGTYLVYSTDVRDPESGGFGLQIVRTELASGRSTVVSTYYGNRLQLGNGASFSPVAGNGARAVAFSSYADSLTPGDTNRTTDVFWRQVGPYLYPQRPRLGG